MLTVSTLIFGQTTTQKYFVGDTLSHQNVNIGAGVFRNHIVGQFFSTSNSDIDHDPTSTVDQDDRYHAENLIML